MKDPYEYRVVADALERWSEGPAVDAMKYAMQLLREIADELDIAKAIVEPQTQQEPIPSPPASAVEVPPENPTPPTPEPAVEASPATSTSSPAESSPAPASDVSGTSTEADANPAPSAPETPAS